MAVSAVAGLMSAVSAGIAAAAAGTAFTIFGLTGLAAYATAFAIGAGLSMVSRALMPSPSLGQNLAGRSVTVRQPDVTRKIIYGQARVGGAIVYLVSTGPKNEYLHLVMTVAGHEIESFEEMWFNDDKVWDKDTGFADDYGDYVLFNRYLGNQTTVDPVLDLASAQWTSAHVLNGVAYAMVRLKYDVDQFAQGLPNISFVVKGKKVYNPITDVTEWTQNPALCVYDYLLDSRYGLAESSSNVNLAALTSAVNLCDQLVAESDNQIRYTLDGVVDSANSRKENIESMLSAMGGSLVYSGGQYFISGSSYVAPTITIDESVMVGSITVSTKKSRRELYNGVKGVFLNAEENYTVVDYPAQISSDYAIADGDPVYLDMGLAFTTNQVRAQRLAKLALLKSRQQTTINVPCNLAALKFKAGDNINVTNTRLGWTNKPFQILGYTLNADSNGSIVVDVSAIETSPELYDWQSSDEKDYLSAGEVYIYDGKTTVAPSSVTATPYTFLAADGTVESGLDVSFPESNDAFVEYYRVEWRTGAEDWQSITTKLTSVQIANLESNVLYDVRVIAVNQLKVDSAPTYTTATTAVDVTPPALPSNLSAVGGLKQIVVTWDNPADTDFKHVQVFAHTSNSIPATPVALVDSESFVLGNLAAGDVRYFWLKSVDFTGNVSAATASISATVAQAATSDIQDEAVTFDKIDVDSIFANTAVINSITSNAIDVATLNANNISSTTSLTVGTGNNVGVISGEDATYRIWAGNQAPASAPFSVDKSGNVILKNIYLSAGGIPLIDQFGFTQEALSQISATTQTEVNTVAKNFITEDGSQLMTLTTNQATTVSLKYVRDGFSAVSTISGNQSYYEVPLNVTLSVKYRKDGGAWNTISQVLAKTASTIPTATQYQVETILNETPTGDRWYSQTVPSKGCINGANDVEYFLTNGLALDANSTYDFYLTLDATVDTTGSPDTIDSDVSDTSSKTLTVTVTSGSGFYVTDGTGSQGTTIDADTLGGQLPSYYASTSYVGTAISNLVDSSPATLDTLNELAAALGDDPNFATTVSTSIGTKWTQDDTKISNWDTAYGWGNHADAGYLTSVSGYLPLAGGTLTGTLAMGANAITSTGTISSGAITASAASTFQGEASNGGTINIGNTAAYRGIISYTGASSTTLSFASSYDDANARIDFNLRTAGTAVTALRLLGSGNATFGGTISSGAITSTGNIRTDYNDTISMAYAPSPTDYHKGMSGSNQSTGTARGLHLFNYDADSNEGIKFWVGTNASRSQALHIASDTNSTFAGTISSGAITSSGQINAGTNLVAGTSVYSNNGVYYGSTTLSLKNNTSGSFLSFAANANATFAGAISSGAITSTGTTAQQDVLALSTAWSTVGDYVGMSMGDGWVRNYVESSTSGYRSIAFAPYGTERLRITASGDLKLSGTTVIDSSRNLTNIGTITASGEITANGGIALGDNDVATFGDGDDLKLYHTGSHSYIDESGTGNLYIGSNNGAGVYIQGSGETLASFVDDGAVTLYHDSAAKLATTSTGIDVTGTATIDGLTVDGAATIDGGATYNTVLTLDSGTANTYLKITDSNSTNGTFIGATTNDLNFYPNNSLAVTMTAAGNVGIGASSPAAKLQVEGETRIYPASGTAILRFGSGGVEKGRLSVDASSNMAFETAGTERLRIDASGKVGIGTSVPYGLTHWQKSSTVNLVATNTGADGQADTTVMSLIGQARGYSNNLSKLASIDFKTDPTTWYYGAITFNVANLDGTDTSRTPLEAMRINRLGNVGIGTSSPSAQLHLQNGSTEDVSGSTIRMDLSGINPYWEVQARNGGSSANRQLGFYTSATSGDVLTLTQAGSVGIGISPVEQLHLGGRTHSVFELQSNSTSGTGRINFSDTTVRGQILYTHTDDSMSFLTSATERLRIDSSGRVGIGTSSPSEKLHVSGNILATGNITAYSDRNLKENIEPILNAVEKVQQLNGVTYNRNDLEDTTKRYAGIIAQDLQAVLPEAVEGDSILRVDYNATIGLLIEAIKELKTEVDDLKAKLKEVTK